jgi:hypothetical protein
MRNYESDANTPARDSEVWGAAHSPHSTTESDLNLEREFRRNRTTAPE